MGTPKGKMLKRFISGILGIGMLVVGAACGSDSTGPTDPTDLVFAPSLGVKLSQMTLTSTGLYYQDLVVGTGDEAGVGQLITVHYTGWLHDGTKFDSSIDRGDPFHFYLGVGSVIAGWDEGVQGMKVGGTRKLVIPPQLGYGPARQGSIPGNSTLVFDVELLGIG